MPLYLFYTMVQKRKNDQKLKSRGGGSCLKYGVIWKTATCLPLGNNFDNF